MNSKADVNRRVLAIQAKKKRHKNNKKRGKQNGAAAPGPENQQPQQQQHQEQHRSSENCATPPAAGAPENANNSHIEGNKVQLHVSGTGNPKSFSNANASTSGGSGSTPDAQSQAKLKNNIHNQQPPRSSSNESDESEMNSENEEQELKEDYCKGGYHPVNIGDLFQGEYQHHGDVTCLLPTPQTLTDQKQRTKALKTNRLVARHVPISQSLVPMCG